MLSNRALDAVIALVDCESFHKAAVRLNMSPAAFSRHIKAAEDYAGFALFIRRRGPVRLTAPGAEFIHHAQRMHTAAQRFDAEIRRLKESAGGGVLKIGCGPLTTRSVIAPALRDVARRFPELRFEVLVRANQEPVVALERREIDLFVGDLTHTPFVEDLEVQVLGKKSLIFVADADHPLHASGPYALVDVLRYPLLSPFLHRHWRNVIVKAFGGDDAALARAEQIPTIQCDDFGLLLALLEESDYVCGGMRQTFSEGLASGRLREIRLREQVLWNISLARRKGETFDALEAVWSRILKNKQQ